MWTLTTVWMLFTWAEAYAHEPVAAFYTQQQCETARQEVLSGRLVEGIKSAECEVHFVKVPVPGVGTEE
jgi:hypothetical protein